MTPGLRRFLTVIMAGGLSGSLTFGLLAYDEDPPPEIQPGVVYVDEYAYCVTDGFCGAPPPANCPWTAKQDDECEMCEYARPRQKCVWHPFSDCAWYEHGDLATGCGDRWLGLCLGPGLSCLPYQGTWDICSRITCEDS